jgi:Transposase domain (DUF772)
MASARNGSCVGKSSFNLAYRWFCRLGLEDPVPDHSTFSVNRLRLFIRESRVVLFESRANEAQDSKGCARVPQLGSSRFDSMVKARGVQRRKKPPSYPSQGERRKARTKQISLFLQRHVKLRASTHDDIAAALSRTSDQVGVTLVTALNAGPHQNTFGEGKGGRGHDDPAHCSRGRVPFTCIGSGAAGAAITERVAGGRVARPMAAPPMALTVPLGSSAGRTGPVQGGVD